jgi:hypothetical protein
VLPKGGLCEASLTTPTSLLKPDRKTLETVATARAHEKKIIREYQLIQQSAIRGEETETRVAQLVNRPEDLPNVSDAPARVRLLNRLDHRPLRIAPDSRTITAADVAATQADATILETSPIGEVDLYED